MKPVVLVDVDLVFFRPDILWAEFLGNMTENGGYDLHKLNHLRLSYESQEDKSKTVLHYNLTKEFSPLRCPQIASVDFWRASGIYFTCRTTDYAEWGIRELQRLGYKVVFVTHNKGNHAKSKYYAVQNALMRFNEIRPDELHIELNDIGWVVTKEKYLVTADLIIDDRLDFLVDMPEHVQLIHFQTCYHQYPEAQAKWDEIPPNRRVALPGWKEIIKHLESDTLNSNT